MFGTDLIIKNHNYCAVHICVVANINNYYLLLVIRFRFWYPAHIIGWIFSNIRRVMFVTFEKFFFSKLILKFFSRSMEVKAELTSSTKC